jgi:hypothetical protein
VISATQKYRPNKESIFVMKKDILLLTLEVEGLSSKDAKLVSCGRRIAELYCLFFIDYYENRFNSSVK